MRKLHEIGIRRFLQVSSILIIVGVIVESVSLLWYHPLSFVLFVVAGITLMAMGIAIYLISLVIGASPAAEDHT